MHSALHTAGGISGGQCCDLGHGNMVEVVLDGVLEAGRGHGKVNGLLCVIAAEHTVDQTAAKGIAAADAVDNVHMVGGREEGFASGSVPLGLET